MQDVTKTPFYRDAEDLAVFVRQRTLFIQAKKTKNSQLTPIEESWLRGDYKTRTAYVKKMHKVLSSYHNEIYLHLLRPDHHRKRAREIYIAQQEKNLAPWNQELLNRDPGDTAAVFKPEPEVVELLLRKTEADRPRVEANLLKVQIIRLKAAIIRKKRNVFLKSQRKRRRRKGRIKLPRTAKITLRSLLPPARVALPTGRIPAVRRGR